MVEIGDTVEEGQLIARYVDDAALAERELETAGARAQLLPALQHQIDRAREDHQTKQATGTQGAAGGVGDPAERGAFFSRFGRATTGSGSGCGGGCSQRAASRARGVDGVDFEALELADTGAGGAAERAASRGEKAAGRREAVGQDAGRGAGRGYTASRGGCGRGDARGFS